MKTIIAGSRTITDYSLVKQAIEDSGFPISVVVSGAARGVDQLGERWAREHKIPVVIYPADWGKYGKSAGPMRNKEMAEYAEGLILIWNGTSKGSASMGDYARQYGLNVFERVVTPLV